MVTMYKLFLLVVITLGIAATGCRSTKNLRKAIAAQAPHTDTTGDAARLAALPPRDAHADSLAVITKALAGIAHNHIDFQTFSGHMHVHYQSGDGKDYDLNVIVRIKKDSFIWVSINAALGIEAFRILITPDSVKILDKLKKIARLRSVGYLQEQVNLPVDFNTVQALLIGNPIFLDTAHVLYYRTDPNQKGLSLFSVGAAFSNFLTLNPDNTPRHSKLDDIDPLRARTGDVTYGDYDYSGPVPFSTYRRFSWAEKSKTDIEIEIKQHKFNEALSVPFSVTKIYKRR